MTNIFKCGVLMRVYILYTAGMYSIGQLFQPNTIMYRVAHSDEISQMAAVALGICAVLGFIDLLINDLLPEKFILLRALKDRHLIMMFIPICYAIQMYTVVKYYDSHIILLFYGAHVVLTPLSVISDLRTRYKFKAVL